MIVVAFTSVALGIAVVAGLAFSGALANQQSKEERESKVDYIVSGVTSLAKADLASGALKSGQTKTYTVAGSAITVTASDNSNNLTDSVNLSLSGVVASTPLSTLTTVAVTKKVTETLWTYGAYSDSNFKFAMSNSEVKGNLFFRSSLSVSGTGNKVHQNYKTTSSTNPTGLLTVNGAILTGQPALSWPGGLLTQALYTPYADSLFLLGQTFNGYTFPKTDALVLIVGNLTLRGTIRGRGTIVVTGNVLVDNNVTYNGGGDKMVVVALGNITFQKATGTLSADGYYFANNNIEILSTFNNTGAVVGKGFNTTQKFVITYDKWLTENDNAVKLKAPGYWP